MLVLAPQMSMSSFVALELIATVSMVKRVGVLLMARQRLHVLLTIGNAKYDLMSFIYEIWKTKCLDSN